MTISWKRLGAVVGVAIVLAASQPSSGNQPYKQYVVKCNPNRCTETDVCEGDTSAPKLCGETRDGPFFAATFNCCCCTEQSKGRWFFGE